MLYKYLLTPGRFSFGKQTNFLRKQTQMWSVRVCSQLCQYHHTSFGSLDPWSLLEVPTTTSCSTACSSYTYFSATKHTTSRLACSTVFPLFQNTQKCPYHSPQILTTRRVPEKTLSWSPWWQPYRDYMRQGKPQAVCAWQLCSSPLLEQQGMKPLATSRVKN